MNLQLYFAPGACSFVPHVLLEKAGVTFEPKIVKLHKGEQYSEEYKAINPRSQVPVLVVDGQPLTQILAICGFLAESFPSANLQPTQVATKAQYTSMLAWMNNSVHPTFTHVFMPKKFTPDEAAQATVKAHNTTLFAAHLQELDKMAAQAQQRGGQYLAALYGHDHLTALDAYMLTFLRWGSIAGIDPTQYAAAWAHVQRIAQVPAVARAIERERIELNMMAKTSA